MPRVIASFLSVIFHPLFFPAYSLFFIDWVSPALLAGADKKVLFPAVILSTVLFPVLTIFLMKKLEMIKSFYLREREERIIPLVAVSMYYFWAYVVIKNLEVSVFIVGTFLGISLAVFASFFFNLFFKISLHTVAAGAFLAMLSVLMHSSSFNLEIPLLVIIIFVGLIGSVRWYLAEHNGFEIFSGYAVGFLSQVIAFRIMG